MGVACTGTDLPETGGGDGATPLFVVAGQSNAEGNVRVSGLRALVEVLPDHTGPLSSDERDALRDAFKAGVGDWCNPAEDYSNETADASIDALRSGGLALSGIDANYTIPTASMAAFRWRFQEANQSLDAPYESTVSNPPTAHTTAVGEFGVGYGVWDDEETEALFYGPELGMGVHFEQQGNLTEFEVVKIAMGGSSLSDHWAPNGPLRAQLYEKTSAHLAARPDTHVAGLIWFQGFNDQFEDGPRNNYADNLTRLIDDFREAYGKDVPVVIVQARKYADLEQIANAQQQVADTLDRVGLAESDGLTQCFHYDAASQMVIGQRVGIEMLNLLNP